MTIIVTGSAGCIGSSLCNWLISNTDYNVIGVDDLSGGYKDNMPIQSDRFKFYQANLIVWDTLTLRWFDKIMGKHKPDVCFHFACYAAEGRSNYIRSFITENNTLSTSVVINACINHKCKLIFTSSVAVYSGIPPFTEDTTPNPIDEYGLSKWTSERSIQIAGETQGLDWCIIRPRNVYGERQSMWDTARNVMGIWMNQILNNQPMTIFGDGSNKRTFTYIGDILEPLYNAINVSKEIVNLGSPMSYSIQEANEVLQLVTGYDKVIYLEERHEVPEAICDTLISEVLLNYEHKTSLIEGLTKMWAWAKLQPKKTMQTPPPLEINIKTHSSIK